MTTEANFMNVIKSIKAGVNAMDKKMNRCATKEDLRVMSEGMRKEIAMNSARIDKLHDMRKHDERRLAEVVTQIVDKKLSARRSANGSTAMSGLEEEHLRAFHLARRSVRLWPVSEDTGVGSAVQDFLTQVLMIPTHITEEIEFELLQWK